MRILVVNAGSSTLKMSVIGDGDKTLAATSVSHSDDEAVRRFIAANAPIEVIGHRIVHGGSEFTQPTALNDDVIAALARLTPLAPLHQGAALAAIATAGATLPGVPAVACFDTAFHSTMPVAAATYALPAAWRRQWGIRRFGFHGLSHQWASQRALDIVGLPREGSRVVTCHLGGGASACAVREGSSVDTTMGFTPMEGLVMATRSGSIDPGLVLWLIRSAGLDPREVDEALDRRSGLAGLTGTDGDMRSVVAAAAGGDESAVVALAVWVRSLRQAIAAMTASLGGLDAVVFTGGVGEHQADLRARVAEGLSFLGIVLDEAANAGAKGDTDITALGAPCRAVVVTAREDLQIARLVRATIAGR
jgi:acetate kinase